MPESHPTLVLLPGMDGTGRLFTNFIQALPPSIQTQIISYPPDQQLTYETLEQRIKPELPTQDFVLLAESFSTPLAIRIAANPSANLKAVILCAGFAVSPIKGLKRFLALRLAPALFRLNPPDFVLRKLLVGPKADSAVLHEVRTAIGSVSPAVMESRLQAITSCDRRPDLEKVSIPTLCLQPSEDHLLPASALARMQSAQPNLEVSYLPSPHLILQTKPLPAAQIIVEFIERVALRPEISHQ